jgi:hypothetical protein
MKKANANHVELASIFEEVKKLKETDFTNQEDHCNLLCYECIISSYRLSTLKKYIDIPIIYRICGDNKTVSGGREKKINSIYNALMTLRLKDLLNE